MTPYPSCRSSSTQPSCHDVQGKFLAMLAYYAGGQHRSAASALAKRATCAADRKLLRNVNYAFNMLGVSEGLRSAGLFSVPKKRPMTAEQQAAWGLYMYEIDSEIAFVVQAAKMTSAQLQELGSKYVSTRGRPDPAIERRVGKLLGYLAPQPEKVKGAVQLWLVLPNGGQNDRRIVSEFGPQSLPGITPAIMSKLQRMQEEWSALAKRVHPEFEVELQINMFDAVDIDAIIE